MCKVVVDGTDFKVEEPQVFDSDYFSHKFHSAGVRYEIATSISTGWIVWTNGPFPCGNYSDIRIARLIGGIQSKMGRGERYIADGGYQDGGEFGITPNGVHDAETRRQKVLRSCHETVNGRFKRWRILSGTYRHDLQFHKNVFGAIANITQVETELEFPAFAV